MVKRLIIASLLLLTAVQLNGQSMPSERWYPGEIILNDKVTRKGQVKYDLEHDAVQVKVNGRTETYSPQQVISFNFRVTQIRRGRERQRDSRRFFFSLPFENEVGFKRLRFFEVVVEGKATLLAREYVTTVTANNGNRINRSRRARGGFATGPQTSTRLVLSHRLFLAGLDGEIRQLTGKKKDIIYLLNDHGDEMKRFIKKERLRMDQVYDVARLFAHYNAVSNGQSGSF